MFHAARVTVLCFVIGASFLSSCKSREFGEGNESSTKVALWDTIAKDHVKNFEDAYELIQRSSDRDKIRRLMLLDATYVDRFLTGRFQSEVKAPLSVSDNYKNGERISLFMVTIYSFIFEYKSFSDFERFKPAGLRHPDSPIGRDVYIVYGSIQNFHHNGPKRTRAEKIDAEEKLKKDVAAEFAKLTQLEIRRLIYSYRNLLSGMNLKWDDHKGTPSYQILDFAEKNNPIR